MISKKLELCVLFCLYFPGFISGLEDDQQHCSHLRISIRGIVLCLIHVVLDLNKHENNPFINHAEKLKHKYEPFVNRVNALSIFNKNVFKI